VDYKEIIEYENESSTLDFKAAQYTKAQHESLIKDVMAMANAFQTGEKMIVIGVKHFPDGRREYLPINDGDFIDSATYQQLIAENIEPYLSIDYIPYRHNDQLLGILRVIDCNNPPYMLKKDSGKLKKGFCLVRKGTHQLPAMRADYDKFYSQKASKSRLYEKLKIGFRGTDFQKTIVVCAIDSSDVPSKRAEQKIRGILDGRSLDDGNIALSRAFANVARISLLFGNAPYEDRSTETLQSNLKNVGETYKGDDEYELLEEKAFKLNFEIFNGNTEYIQDVRCVLEIPKIEGVYVPEDIVCKPSLGIYSIDHLHLINSTPNTYPDVVENENAFVISQAIGDLKHQIPTMAFFKDVRLSVLDCAEVDSLPIILTLYAKDLPEPLVTNMKIKVSRGNG